ncbi:unnamed protein product [Heligmosomoides polygyrus]|uniref:Lysosomal-associated transmembrane protein 4B n=1 Tax=Heligmosomoides polygyrus TaxID=6339 RepID=A0A183F6F0_HELPZ|nr:unnamed protein product [Heligmosomoides polygyrus]
MVYFIVVSAFYYKDCSEGLLKRAPCKECWPNATTADYSFVTTNVTIFDYDNRDTTSGTSSVFTFVGIALDLLLVFILVRAVYLKVIANRTPSGSSRYGPVTFEVTDNPTSSSASDSETMLHSGDRLRSYFSSSTSESGTMLSRGRQPLSGPSDTPQMTQFYYVREAAMLNTLHIIPNIPLNPPPSRVRGDDSSSEDKTQWQHSSSSESVTNVSGNGVDVDRSSEGATTAADEEQTLSSVTHSDTSELE